MRLAYVAAVGHEDGAIAGQEQQQVEAAVDDGGLPAGRGGKEEAGRRQDDQAGVEEDQVAAPAVEQWVPGAFLEGGQTLSRTRPISDELTVTFGA